MTTATATSIAAPVLDDADPILARELFFLDWELKTELSRTVPQAAPVAARSIY